MSQHTANPNKPSSARHSLATRLFHHGTVVFMIVISVLAFFADELESMMSAHPIGVHKAAGALFLFWVIARLINLAVRPKVPYATPAPKWQTAAAHLVHFGLYGCMLAMPIVGILMSVYGGRAVSVFGLFEIPTFVSPDREMAKFFNTLHTDVIFPLLIALILVHIVAAIYHQVILKDNLLSRMK